MFLLNFCSKSIRNYAELFELNYFQLIYYIIGQSLLQIRAGISKWGSFITKWVKYYKNGQALRQIRAVSRYYNLEQELKLLHSGDVTTAQSGAGTTNSAGNYMFRVNDRNTRTRCKICSK